MRLPILLLTTCLLACSPGARTPLSPRPAALAKAHLPDDEARHVAGVLDTLIAGLAPATVVCVSLRADAAGPYALPPAVLRHVQAATRVRSPSDCPPTFDSMVALVDSAGQSLTPPRPAGYTDPVYLAISRPHFERAQRAHLLIEGWQGTQGWVMRCISDGLPARVWCRRLESWIS
jgi:hypothetical protein